MSGYAFHPDAFADLDEIWEYGVLRTLAASPRIGHRRPDLTSRPLRFHVARNDYLMYLLLVAVLMATIGCDRVTERIATDTLAGVPDRSFIGGTITVLYTENRGGFVSQGAGFSPRGRTAVFVVGTGLVLVAVGIGMLRSRLAPWPLLGATLFVAGGASNWFDRVTHGTVIDFLNVGIGPVRTGVFNVADMAILVGVGLIIVGEARLTWVRER
jgi:signal peptidase II